MEGNLNMMDERNYQGKHDFEPKIQVGDEIMHPEEYFDMVVINIRDGLVICEDEDEMLYSFDINDFE
jgi:hypothetical protein